MLVLLGIAFLAGVITAISPCVLPVLPIVLAGGASGGRRRPFAIVAGLLTTFVVSILFAAYVLDKLGLPQDLLRNLSIALLFVIAATLLVPQIGQWIERALARFSRRSSKHVDSGFLLGCALGFAFVPCGGPILAYVSAQSASVNFGFRPVALAIAYALGAGVVLFGIAVGGQRIAAPLRTHALALRRALGAVIAVAAIALVFNVDTKLQTSVPGWTDFFQNHTERTAFARDRLYGKTKFAAAQTPAAQLPDYGAAPSLAGGGNWFNSAPLTMQRLRGKVVLIDFWTYSCINCLRTLPQLEAWDAKYRKDGLVIVGVHTPEFAFERVESNVKGAVRRLGVRYPVVQDNDYDIWNGYSNQYWPAEYLIDRRGHVRHAHFGEGEYDRTETLIRRLLGVDNGTRTQVRDETPGGELTPESYIGSARAERFVGGELQPGRPATYRFPATVPQDGLALDGQWTVLQERALTGAGAKLRVRFHAAKVFLVLGGKGKVNVLLDGKKLRTVRVDGDRLYTLVDSPHTLDSLLELRFTPGISAYAFTFG
ncbi:MAG: cytochrome c biogenesis protein DipZ [Gaiellaceae bacterium]|jgi:cytochrome c biogenesis protein CcdA/thiol-disulfide isomerase/thioredoxin